MTDGVTDDILNAGRVKRYHTWPQVTQQTVAGHCWALYVIYCQLWGEWPSANVCYYIMHHDSAELVVGDPPFPVKRDNPALKAAYDAAEVEANFRLGVVMPEVEESELARVKVCDLLEMFCHGLHEYALGNEMALPIITRTADAAAEVAESRLGHAARVLVHQYVTAARARCARRVPVING